MSLTDDIARVIELAAEARVAPREKQAAVVLSETSRALSKLAKEIEDETDVVTANDLVSFLERR